MTVVLGDAPREDVPHRLDETYVITPKASAIGDAPHEDVPVTCGDLGVIRWCTRPSTGLTRSARAFNKVDTLAPGGTNMATRSDCVRFGTHQLDRGRVRCMLSD